MDISISTNSYEVDSSDGEGVIYNFPIVDDQDPEFRYIRSTYSTKTPLQTYAPCMSG